MTSIPRHDCPHCSGRHGCLACGFAEDDHSDATFLDACLDAAFPGLGDRPPATMIRGPEPRAGAICRAFPDLQEPR